MKNFEKKCQAKKSFWFIIINTLEAEVIKEKPKPAPEKKGKSFLL